MEIENHLGCVEFYCQYDLNKEKNNENYMPGFYQDSVIELRQIKAHQKGSEHTLMQAFLNHELVKSAKAIFLDCSPLYLDGEEVEIMQRSHDFYAKYGFVGILSNGYSRMWRIQSIPEPKYLIDFLNFNYDCNNDFYSVLKSIAKLKGYKAV